MSSAGVTSNAGFNAGKRAFTSPGSRSSIGISAPVAVSGSIVDVGATTKNGTWCRAATTASGYVPILLAVSPLAAIRSAPTKMQSTSPRASKLPAAESATTVCGMPSASSSHAVSRAPWSSGRVSSTSTCCSNPRAHASRSAPSAVPCPPVASPPVLQCVSARVPGASRLAAWELICRQRSTSSTCSSRARATGSGAARTSRSAQARFAAVGRAASSRADASAGSSPRSTASAYP